MQILYVDRVVHSKRRVHRAIPRMKGWTDLLLKKREENEGQERDFGLGRVAGQYEPHEVDSAIRSRAVDSVAATDKQADGDVDSMKGVWDATKYIGDGLKMLATELNKAGPELKKKDDFKITCDTLRKAFRLDNIEFHPVGSMTQSKSANDSESEDWAHSLKSLIEAANHMEMLENKDEFPSFSLGFESDQVKHEFYMFNLYNALSYCSILLLE